MDRIPLLTNCVAITGQAGTAGEALRFRMEVPPGARRLTLRAHGDGEVSIYVTHGRMPSVVRFDHRSVKLGGIETVAIDHPRAGMYRMLMVGRTRFSDVFVLGVYL